MDKKFQKNYFGALSTWNGKLLKYKILVYLKNGSNACNSVILER